MTPPPEMWLLLAVTLVSWWVCPSQGQHYHYNRPSVAFHSGHRPPPPPPSPQRFPQAQHRHQPQLPQHNFHHQSQQSQPLQHSQQSQPVTYLVHTLGPQSRAYELEMQKSKTLYVLHQPGGLQANSLTYGPPSAISKQSFQITHPTPQLQPQAHVTSSNSNQNPLLSHAPLLSRVSPAPAVVTPPQPVRCQTKTACKSGGAQPYAVVQLPSGQRVLDAGHGSGAAPQQELLTDEGTKPRVGDYHAQSQTSQLDSYPYKRSVPENARNYQRYITTCQPNGQCQRVALGPGQMEPGHQHLLAAARAQTLPDCGQSKNDIPDSYYRGGKTPTKSPKSKGLKNRRTYPHTETVVPRDPYN